MRKVFMEVYIDLGFYVFLLGVVIWLGLFDGVFG